jgi:ribonuclease Z
MDHWAGFDLFLRLALGREMTVRVFGPPGMIDRVEHKIRAYTWNLLGGYAAGVSLVVTEVGEDGPAARARFALASGFAREPLPPPADRTALIEEENLRVTAVTLDHGIPCLGYAIEEKARVNVWKNRLAEMGLESGPWLRELKALALGDAPDDTPVAARGPEGERRLPLGLLRERVLTVAEGRKLAYVTDVGWTAGNVERIRRLAQGAWLLVIEATFLDRDRERAAARRHLTARQAGTLARLAGAERVLPFHFSPRHAEEEAALRAELEAAYAGEVMAPVPEGDGGGQRPPKLGPHTQL